MKKILYILFFILPVVSMAQYDSSRLLQGVAGQGFTWKNGKFGGLNGGSLVIPYDTVKMAVRDSGAITYKGGSIWLWNGYIWVLSSGSGAAIDSSIYKSNGTIRANTNRTVTIPSTSTLAFPQTHSGTSYNKIHGFFNTVSADAEGMESYESSTVKTGSDSITMKIGKDESTEESFELIGSGNGGLNNYFRLSKYGTDFKDRGGAYASEVHITHSGISMWVDSAGSSRSALYFGNKYLGISLTGGAKMQVNNVEGSIGQALGIKSDGNFGWITAGGGSGTNIGNSDLTLSGNRVLSGGGYNLTLGNGIGSNIGALTFNTGSFQFNGNGGTTFFGNASGKLSAQSDTINLNAINQLKFSNLSTSTDPADYIVSVNSAGVVFRKNTLYITNNLTTQGYVDSLVLDLTTTTGDGSTITLPIVKKNWLQINPSSLLTADKQIILPNGPPQGAEVLISFGGTIGGGSVVANQVTVRVAGSDSFVDPAGGAFTFVNSGEAIRYKYNSPTHKWYRN